jgi:TolB-like protein/DNA-binding winged helix-turn-helix (wHTH) protein
LIFQFNQISIDTTRFRLCLSNEPISVEPQVFDILVYLIENRDRVVTRDELLENLWKGKVVTDSTLGARLKDVRKAVGDSGDKQEVIKTFHRRGYQFIADVTEVPTAQSSEKIETLTLHEVLPLSDKPLIAGPFNKTHSIAVLPFDNLSGDPSQEYFSDGVTESIILNLSLFPELNVKSRNSGFAFKQQIKSLGKIPRELTVDYLVEGSIHKTEDRIRITVQLIETTTGNQVWGKRYDAEVENLFDLEEKLSRSIAATVTGQIDSDLQRIAINKGAAHQDSYHLSLIGIYHCYKFTRPGMKIAIDKLNQCLKNDPDNVRAHATIFVCYLLNFLQRWVVDHQASFELAGVHISRALSLDPGNGYVQALYAEYLIYCRQSSKALGHANKALQINPNDSHASTMKAFALEMLGEYQQAVELAELGHQLDPYIPWADWNLAECQIFSGQYEKALETITNSKNDPELLKMYYIVANIKLGRKEPARKALKEYLQECRSSMVSMPTTLDEWLQFSMSYTPFEDTSLNEEIINCLKLAGLAEELSSQMVDDTSLHTT